MTRLISEVNLGINTEKIIFLSGALKLLSKEISLDLNVAVVP